MTATTQSAPALPDELAGWKWQTHPTGDVQLRSSDGYATKWYTKPEKAVAEAQRRVLSTPKPKVEQELAAMMAQSDMVPLARIRTDGGTQARAQLNPETVAEYTETWQTLSYQQNGLSVMPPIVVYYDGADYWLADGFHRVEAYKRFLSEGTPSASPRALRAEIRQGTRRDAVLYACGANAAHGLRRTNADKRRAVETLLRDEEWRQWSDRKIAESCAVDHKTVASLRADLIAGGEIPHLAERQGVDGKVYAAPAPTAADSDEPAAGDPRIAAMRERWLALGYLQFYPSDKGYTAYHPKKGTSNYKKWAFVEADIARKEAMERPLTPPERDANGKFMPSAAAAPEPSPDLASAAAARLRIMTGWHIARVGDMYRIQARAGGDIYETDADGVRAAARLLEASPDLTLDALMEAVNALPDEAPALALSVRFRHSSDRAETDLDDVIAARLAALGVLWVSAAITPDGRWHHLVSVRNTALLRRDQTRMRIERLEALIANTVGQRAEPNAPDPKTPTAPTITHVPIIHVTDPALFDVAEASYSANDGYLNRGKMRRPFEYDGKLWISVGGNFDPRADDISECVRVVEAGETYARGEKYKGFRDGAYTGDRAKAGGKEYELTGQFLIVHRPHTPVVVAPPAPTLDRQAAIAAGAPSIPDDIRQAAGRLELLIEVRPDGLLLHWPDEDASHFQPQSIEETRRWLADEGPRAALLRLDQRLERHEPALQKAGYFWYSADPPIIRHNDGWSGDAPTVEGALQLARDRQSGKTVPAAADSAIDWNAIARASYALGAVSNSAVAWAKWLEIGRLLAASEPETAAAHALRLIEGLIPKLPKTELIEDLSRAIADLNECEEGTEWPHWTSVGWALLDCEATP